MPVPADLIILNAKIFTSDPHNPQAEALALSDKRIVYVGDRSGVEAWRGVGTRVIDGQGGTLTAGFIDSHFHLLWGSIWLGSAQLQEVTSFVDLSGVLADFAAANPAEAWVVGRGIKYNIVFDRQQLDYLNFIEKFHCSYCAYGNGLMAYVSEIVGRTEEYFCPIKHARKVLGNHSRYARFLGYGEAADYQSRLEAYRVGLGKRTRAPGDAD